MDGSETLERAIEIAVRAHAGQLYPASDGQRGPYRRYHVAHPVDHWGHCGVHYGPSPV